MKLPFYIKNTIERKTTLDQAYHVCYLASNIIAFVHVSLWLSLYFARIVIIAFCLGVERIVYVDGHIGR